MGNKGICKGSFRQLFQIYVRNIQIVQCQHGFEKFEIRFIGLERLSVVVLLVAEKSTEKYRSVPLPLFCDGSHQEAPPESVQSWVLSKEMYCVPPRPLNSSDVISTENISSSGGAGFSFLEHPQIIIAVSTNKNNFFIVRFI